MSRLIPIWLLFSTCVLATEPKFQRDVPYAEPNNERQMLDVYAPPEGKGHPIVFWIHGGGWQAGDKTDVKLKPQTFVDKGFVFVSTNYRFVPQVTIDVMAGDVAKAIRWTYDHAEDFGGDRETFFIMGHSAGAQLAALLCTDERYLEAEDLSLSIVKGCVPVDGDTYDVPMQIATVEQRRKDIYRMKFGDEEQQKNLSPVTHVGKDKEIPPFLILHVAGHPETQGQSHRLVNALKEADIPAKAYPAEGKNHVSLNDELGKPDDQPTAALFSFLNRVLKESAVKAAVKKDRKLYEGTWRAVGLTVDGNKAADADARKITVVNDANGSWTLHSEGKKVGEGTSTIDPTQTPKTIDLTTTDDAGNVKTYLGIYEIFETTRRLCFAPEGKPRPTEFSSAAGTDVILVEFERI
ncbi:MAG: TIGR03067 domain-containing protein [Planctomycetaceae bacterium]